MAVNDSILNDFSEYLYARRGLAESTIHNYVAAIRRLTPQLGERPTHRAVDRCVTEIRRAGASYSHVKNTSQAIEQYMAFLGDPLKLGRPRKPKPLLKSTLTEAEVTLLIAAGRNLRERAILSLLACSGLRNKELCSLTVADVDLAGQLVRVRCGKGGKDRAACIGACAETLSPYLRDRAGASEDLLFVTRRHKHALAPQDLRKLVRLAARRAKLSKRVHPHLLRHSLATNMLHRGAGLLAIKQQLLAIKQQLGHSFIETTMLYLHSAPARMQAEYRFFAPSYL